jgi:hypothetical protein
MKHRRRSKFPLSSLQGEPTFFLSDDCKELLEYIKNTLDLDIVPEVMQDFAGLKISVCYEDGKGGIAVLPIEWKLPPLRFENTRESRLWTAKKIVTTVMLFQDSHVSDEGDIQILSVVIPKEVVKVRDAWRRKYSRAYDRFIQRMLKEMRAIGVNPSTFESTAKS